MTTASQQVEQGDIEAAADAVFRMGASFDVFTSQMRRAFNLNAHERLAISALWARGPLTMTELGSCIPLSRAAVTTLVDRLEGAGLVVRGSHSADRRRTVVSVSDATIDRMRPVIAPWGEGLAQLVAARDADEWATISQFLLSFRELNDDHSERLAALGDDEIRALAGA